MCHVCLFFLFFFKTFGIPKATPFWNNANSESLTVRPERLIRLY